VNRWVKVGIGVAVAAGVLLLIGWLAPFFTTGFVWQLRRALFWVLPLAALVALVLAVYVGTVRSRRGGLVALAWVVGIAGLGVFIWYASSYHSYQHSHDSV
jgi:uncharacterized integral membrane protein